VRSATRPTPRFETLARGELVKLAYRLGLSRATGVLTVAFDDRRELLVLRRGFLMTGEIDPLGRKASQRLSRLAGIPQLRVQFDGGVAAYPPGAVQRQYPIAVWARRHLEAGVDAGRARDMVSELAGVRLSVRPELAPAPAWCDASDLRILDAMRRPRRLDQIWPLARTPRFRLMAFLHFLREVGALEQDGVAADVPRPRARRDSDAHRVLGVDRDADRVAVKRAYRRLARALHPDLHPGASSTRRRALERKLADITDAYRELAGC
jgi:hypothetical protein